MKILIIQTAFIGDVILATPVLEKLHQYFPDAQLDILVRKGTESLFTGHPFLHKVLVFDKKAPKVPTLSAIISEIREQNYDKVINLHRFGSSGFITMLSGAKEKIGFDKNPFSFAYTTKLKHVIGNGKHEVARNLELIAPFTDDKLTPPKLYPSPIDYESAAQYKSSAYICIAPSSIWATKELTYYKWEELIENVAGRYKVYLLGAASDVGLCDVIKIQSGEKVGAEKIINLAGKLSFLQSAALMKDAAMNYANDSAPMHIASAMNAPITAVYCSTVPSFGFGPLSDKSFIVETQMPLDCRPCGLHGYKECPKGHFLCSLSIKVDQLVKPLES